MVRPLGPGHQLRHGVPGGAGPRVCGDRSAPASFVGSKLNPRWVWIALCRQTRQVVALLRGRSLRRRVPVLCASASRLTIAAGPPAATTGWLTRRPVRHARTVSAAKRRARPTTSNAGTAPCASAWAVSYGARFPFPNARGCTTLPCVCSCITAIFHSPCTYNHYPLCSRDYPDDGALVPALLAFSARRGGTAPRARVVRGSHDHLALGAALRTRSSTSTTSSNRITEPSSAGSKPAATSALSVAPPQHRRATKPCTLYAKARWPRHRRAMCWRKTASSKRSLARRHKTSPAT